MEATQTLGTHMLKKELVLVLRKQQEMEETRELTGGRLGKFSELLSEASLSNPGSQGDDFVRYNPRCIS